MQFLVDMCMDVRDSGDDLEKGAVVVAAEFRYRVRYLPIGEKR